MRPGTVNWWSGSGSAISRGAIRSNCPADSSSASRSAGRWRQSRCCLLADEPTGNLDEDTADEVLALARDLVARSGCGFLMVTHSTRLAATLDRRVTLHAGRIQ